MTQLPGDRAITCRYVAEIEELLKENGVEPIATENPPLSRRQWAVFTVVAVTIFVLLAMLASGILLGLMAKIFM